MPIDRSPPLTWNAAAERRAPALKQIHSPTDQSAAGGSLVSDLVAFVLFFVKRSSRNQDNGAKPEFRLYGMAQLIDSDSKFTTYPH